MLNRKSSYFAALCAAAVALVSASPSQASGSIAWRTSLDSGLAEAKKTGKPVMVYFWATWCGPCKLMVKSVYPKPSVVAESKKWVMVKLDFDKNEKAVRKYNVAANLPQFLFLTPGGKLASKTQGYKSESALVAAMRGAYRGAKK